jgi:acetyltransferase-like isoleucine patch superfamily enzyme
MRKIGLGEILTFLFLLASAAGLAFITTKVLLGKLPLGDFRGIALLAATAFFFYLYAIVIYRIFLHFMPLREGEIEEKSREEFGYHVYILFFLVVFYPLMRSGVTPMPLMRLVYQALGAKLGANTYSAGIIHDPCLVEIGSYSAVGQYAVLVPHVIEGRRLAHYKIRIGDNVTIGTHAVVLPGVTIGDNALVAAGAVVLKGTQIGPNEIWGGVPAKHIRTKS